MINPLSALGRDPHPAPIYRLIVDGRDMSDILDARLIDLTLTDNRGFEADSIDLRLDDSDGLLALPTRGAEIELWLGWKASGLIYKGSYTVDEVEHSGAPDVLSIRARSADLREGLTQQIERSWHDTTLGDIVETIADENELEPVIPAKLAREPIDHIDQTNESAVNLLTRLAKQFDAVATVKDGRLLFYPAAGGLSASGQPLPTVTIKRDSGDQHRFAISDRNAYTAVKAVYNDIERGVKGEIIWGKEEDSTERKVKPKKEEPAPVSGQYKDDGKTHKSRSAALKAVKKSWKAMQANKASKGAYVGAKSKYNDKNLSVQGEITWGQADEEKKQQSAKKLADKDYRKQHPDEKPEPINHSSDSIKILRHVYASKGTAQRGARTEWRKLQRGMATFSITLAIGRPELFPDLPATVDGFKPEIDHTDWILTRVTHTLGDQGMTTAVELEIKATEVQTED